MSDLTTAPDELTTHAKLLSWVDEIASLTEPDSVYWCDGSAEEYDRLAQVLIDAGTFERLDQAKRPNSYLALSDPNNLGHPSFCSPQCLLLGTGLAADQQLAPPLGRNAEPLTNSIIDVEAEQDRPAWIPRHDPQRENQVADVADRFHPLLEETPWRRP